MSLLPGLFRPLFERRCAACAVPVPAGHDGTNPPLCAACAEKLRRRTGGYCPACGNMTALPWTEPALCGPCLRKKTEGGLSPLEAFYFFASYEGLLRELILRCKSARELSLAFLLGNLLAGHPGITGPYDAVIPVPLHSAKLRARGFNQAQEIARPLAARLRAPLRPELLARAKPTHTQSGLTLTERRRNVHGAFVAAAEVRAMRLLLVDDIATTCATLEEAAASLLERGAAGVHAAVLGRTPEHAVR